MSVEETKAIVRRVVDDVVNQGKFEAAATPAAPAREQARRSRWYACVASTGGGPVRRS